MNRETDSTIRQIEFELEKTEHGMGLPYDAERVGRLRKMLLEARKRNKSGSVSGWLARRWGEPGKRCPNLAWHACCVS